MRVHSLPQRSLPALIALSVLLGACGTRPSPPERPPAPTPSSASSPQAREERNRRILESCRSLQPRLSGLMRTLRQAERELADAKAEVYVPAQPAPRFDERAEARFRPEDQEIDRERHEAALAEWRRQDAARRRRWASRRGEQVARAQSRLDRTANELRQAAPELFTGPTSIEFVPAVEQRLKTCDPVLLGIR